MRVVMASMVLSLVLFGCGKDEPATTNAADAAAGVPPAPSTSSPTSASTTNTADTTSTTGSPAASPPVTDATNAAAPMAPTAPRDATTSTGSGPGADPQAPSVSSSQSSPRVSVAPGSTSMRKAGVAREYTIEQGDTLAKIAKAHDLDAKDLAKWNAIDNPRRLQIGQKIRLSPPGG